MSFLGIFALKPKRLEKLLVDLESNFFLHLFQIQNIRQSIVQTMEKKVDALAISAITKGYK